MLVETKDEYLFVGDTDHTRLKNNVVYYLSVYEFGHRNVVLVFANKEHTIGIDFKDYKEREWRKVYEKG